MIDELLREIESSNLKYYFHLSPEQLRELETDIRRLQEDKETLRKDALAIADENRELRAEVERLRPVYEAAKCLIDHDINWSSAIPTYCRLEDAVAAAKAKEE